IAVLPGDGIGVEVIDATIPVLEQALRGSGLALAFRLAERRKSRGRPGRVTCVDKANVFLSMAFFRRIFEEVAAAERIERAVDAAFASGRLRPFEFGGRDGTSSIRDAVLSNL
ncbi:MAG: hypothetical protein OEW90_14550, partial [Betaproteobacteria bacterium]|nr:hypothetical protein [Betaproteobacteria bacterium]